MKSLFLCLYMHTPHFETELEIMADLIESGRDVYVLGCRGQLASCELNPGHRKHVCVFCRSKFEHGMRKAGVPRSHILDFPEPHPDFDRLPDSFPDTGSLMAYAIDGDNIGRGVASSLITRINKDPHFDTLAHVPVVRKELESAYFMNVNLARLFRDLKPDSVHFFNGRFCTYYPAVIQCRKSGIPFFTHERAGVPGRYLIRQDCLPHDLPWAHREIAEIWAKAPAEREKVGRDWFSARRNGVEQAWTSYTTDQKVGKLPDSFDRARRNIAVFSSTLEEFATIPGYENPLFKDEVEAMRSLLEAYRGNGNIRFYLRLHPNMRNIPRRETYQLREVEGLASEHANLEVIWPESAIHTYALMDACDSVLTFGSTMGIEANYWGKPSILVGRAFYEGLGGCYRPATREEFFGMIKSDLPPLDNLPAIQYGYWETVRGIPFKRFRQEGIFGGAFMGETLGPSLLARIRSFAYQAAEARNEGGLGTFMRKKAIQFGFGGKTK